MSDPVVVHVRGKTLLGTELSECLILDEGKIKNIRPSVQITSIEFLSEDRWPFFTTGEPLEIIDE